MLTISNKNLHPQETVSSSSATMIGVYVEDNVFRTDRAGTKGENCGQAISNVDVDLRNTIVPNTGSHNHFKNEHDRGTGLYVEPIPSGIISSDKTEINDGRTNEQGVFVAQYNAGFYGVSEKITATITNSETGKQFSDNLVYNIKVPDLIPLEETGKTYTVVGGLTICDNSHNDKYENGDLIRRRSHYVTPSTYDKVQELHDRFFDKTGVHISVNDASLDFGFFLTKEMLAFIEEKNLIMM